METAGVNTFVLTGATGFLGGHLMAALVKSGERLIVLGRASPELSLAERVGRQLHWFGLDDRSDQVETLEGDLLEPGDRKSTRLNSSHRPLSRMPSSA